MKNRKNFYRRAKLKSINQMEDGVDLEGIEIVLRWKRNVFLYQNY